MEKFLKIFLIICGIIEIVMGIFLVFINPLFNQMGLTTIPLANQMAGIELAVLGILLAYSSKNIKQYKIIIIVSIIFRFIMPIFEIISAINIPILMYLLIGASIYDFSSALLTLLLLIKLKYIKLT